jgi:hypothetical protein
VFLILSYTLKIFGLQGDELSELCRTFHKENDFCFIDQTMRVFYVKPTKFSSGQIKLHFKKKFSFAKTYISEYFF